MDTTNTITVSTTDGAKFQPLKYEVGEICKCYYNEMKKVVGAHESSVAQATFKCQGYCRVVERDDGNQPMYTVEVFDPVGERIKKLPGSCLRKTKLVPFTKEEAIGHMGETICSKGGVEHMMVVAVSDYDGIVRINDINVNEIMQNFMFSSDKRPCAKIVTLKADEAFGVDYATILSRKGGV